MPSRASDNRYVPSRTRLRVAGPVPPRSRRALCRLGKGRPIARRSAGVAPLGGPPASACLDTRQRKAPSPVAHRSRAYSWSRPDPHASVGSRQQVAHNWVWQARFARAPAASYLLRRDTGTRVVDTRHRARYRYVVPRRISTFLAESYVSSGIALLLAVGAFLAALAKLPKDGAPRTLTYIAAVVILIAAAIDVARKAARGTVKRRSALERLARPTTRTSPSRGAERGAPDNREI